MVARSRLLCGLLLLGMILGLPAQASSAVQQPAMAGALRARAWGQLPIAVNEYWTGGQGHCPYENCGEPYSFVRAPHAPPPFTSTDGGGTWRRNRCFSLGPWPQGDDTCQGPYEGAGENFGKAFALLGQDAPANYGSTNPRGAVELDCRYNALLSSGTWHLLITSSQWLHDVDPLADGQGRDAMAAVLVAGGYGLVPRPGSVREPPLAYQDAWGYCWGAPPQDCFNYPATGRPEPYDSLQFLSGAAGVFLAHTMYDDGNYQGGRYAPGRRLVVMAYNGYAGSQWGVGGHQADNAVLIGFVGVIIVGYGSTFDEHCAGTPGDWQSYAPCISGPATTVYGLVPLGGELRASPETLLRNFLPGDADIEARPGLR